jgi:hypothetical protein
MRRKTLNLAFVLGIPVGPSLFRDMTAVGNRSPEGVFAGLRAGQPVVLRDLGTAYEVTTMGG